MIFWRNQATLLKSFWNINNMRQLSNKSAWITNIKRSKYLRMYPTCFVFHDGSTVTIRFHEPRRIVKLPLDISTVSEEERQLILERRKPKKKVVIEEEIEDDFDHVKYLKMVARKSVGRS